MKESLTEQKQKLLAIREDYKQALLDEVKDLKTDLITTKNWVLLTTAGLIFTYIALKSVAKIVEVLTTEDKPVAAPPPTYPVYNPREEEKETFLTPIIKAIKNEMLTFLLAIARQKLRELLAELPEKIQNFQKEKQ